VPIHRASHAEKNHVKFSEETPLSLGTEQLRSLELRLAHYDGADETVTARLLVHCFYPNVDCIYHTPGRTPMQGKPHANAKQKTSHKMRGYELRTIPIVTLKN
jgi:hypothetical protein